MGGIGIRTGISKQARMELIEALRQRYGEVAKKEKTRILDEFVAVARFHRKHAIRLLNNSLTEMNRSNRKPRAGGFMMKRFVRR